MNADTWYYQYLDLPPIPEEFIREAQSILADERSDPINSYSLGAVNHQMFRKLDLNGEEITSRSVIRFRINTEFEDWIQANIVSDYVDVGVAPSARENPQDHTLGAHTDTTRNYLLLYIFDTSNQGQRTAWWQERGHPVVRERNIYNNVFDTMTKLAETEFEMRRWVLMNATILHSVHNVQGYRNAIHVSLDQVESLQCKVREPGENGG
jgi:hypothetical protein